MRQYTLLRNSENVFLVCFDSSGVVESSVEDSTRNGEHRVIDHRAVTYISDPFNKLVLVERMCFGYYYYSVVTN